MVCNLCLCMWWCVQVLLLLQLRQVTCYSTLPFTNECTLPLPSALGSWSLVLGEFCLKIRLLCLFLLLIIMLWVGSLSMFPIIPDPFQLFLKLSTKLGLSKLKLHCNITDSIVQGLSCPPMKGWYLHEHSKYSFVHTLADMSVPDIIQDVSDQ